MSCLPEIRPARCLRTRFAVAAALCLPVATLTSSNEYNPGLAEALLLASDAAYCGDSKHGGTGTIVDWSCPPCAEAASGGTPIRLHEVVPFENLTQQTFGFAGRLSKDTVVVSLRGSVLAQNFADDHDEMLVPAHGSAAGRARWPGARVHNGMYRSYRSLEQPMLAAVARLLESSPPDTTVLVTGHSLGAGQAVYGSAVIAAAYPRHNVVLYSFGTPRPGDVAFAKALNSTLPNLSTYAVTHRADIVPQCGIYPAPCSELRKGLRQIKTNIWYPGDVAVSIATRKRIHGGQSPEGGWIECDGTGEDPDCQDSLLKYPKLFNWNDHNNYFNHSMYCCGKYGHGGKAPRCMFPFPS
eukprot:SAG31_NODE_3537_length_4145_cov_3.205141_4_plen_354_part_00